MKAAGIYPFEHTFAHWVQRNERGHARFEDIWSLKPQLNGILFLLGQILHEFWRWLKSQFAVGRLAAAEYLAIVEENQWMMASCSNLIYKWILQAISIEELYLLRLPVVGYISVTELAMLVVTECEKQRHVWAFLLAKLSLDLLAFD